MVGATDGGQREEDCMRSVEPDASSTWTVLVEDDAGTRISFQDRRSAEECARALALERRPSHVVVEAEARVAPPERFEAI
jgi:hypothetical protein